MRHFAIIAIFVSIGLGNNTYACDIGGSSLFVPTLERWDQHPGPKQQDPEAEGDYWEKVPPPVINVVSVTRGSAAPGSTCGDAGIIELEISLPEKSTYDIAEFGFYFRVKSGRLPDEIFPNVPLLGVIKNGKSYLTLAWLDGHPKYQFPLDVEVEIFLVSNGLDVGPSTFFTITSNVGKG